MKKFLLLFSAIILAANAVKAQTAILRTANTTTTPTTLFAADETLPEGCLYTALGRVAPTEGWGATEMPTIDDVTVEAYEGYVIIRAFAGVEGYDMMVEVDEDDNVLSVTPIINGVEGNTATSGYSEIPTGREDFTFINAYLGAQYCYGGLYDDESGYVLLSCYIGGVWSYYHCSWPQVEEQPWENPFVGEATLLYTAVGKTCNATSAATEGEEDEWGETIFPTVENVKVDVYDQYIYIHALGGVEGYDAKVAYDSEGNVLSIIGIVNGVESEPCKSYLYLSTGREDIVTIQAYVGGYSYATSREDLSGYVLLGAYIYKADDSSDWNYYNLEWESGELAHVENLTSDNAANSTTYNLQGQKVADNYKGIVIRSGKKILKK